MIDFVELRKRFIDRGMEQDVSEYEDAYRELLARIESICKASPGGEWGDAKRIKEYSFVLRQVLLHRSINLFEGALTALLFNNVYSMALLLRGNFETTGALGYLHKRLDSFAQGNIDSKKVDEDICIQILGSREKGIPNAPEAKNVLSMLEYADITVSKNIFQGTSNQCNMLTDCYLYLCEFSHPNFHSNSIAYDLDKPNSQFILRHSKPMRDIEFKLIGYLLLSAPIFIDLFDKVGEKLLEIV